MTIEKKTDQEVDEPFLARWSRVKQSGEASTSSGSAVERSTSIHGRSQPKIAEEVRPEPTSTKSDAVVALPSLDSMTPQSDFSPFMAKDVDPQLRNQAMKMLFTDPHYNVMDRLDIYIDDYSTHAPLPLDVIRRMSISKALRLFDDDEEKADGDSAAVPAPPPLAPPTASMSVVQQPSAADGLSVEQDSVAVAGVAVGSVPTSKQD